MKVKEVFTEVLSIIKILRKRTIFICSKVGIMLQQCDARSLALSSWWKE